MTGAKIDTNADLLAQLAAVREQMEALQAQNKATAMAQDRGEFYQTINRRPRLNKLTFGLVDPEQRLLDKRLKQGCALIKVVRRTRTMSTYFFKNPS